MNYKIIHKTEYNYFEPVSLCHNIARLIPRSTNKQFCKKAIVSIDPVPDIVNEYEDFFGNKVIYFAIEKEHKRLTVTVFSEIEKSNLVDLETGLQNNISWEQARNELQELRPEFEDVMQYIPETSMTASDIFIDAYAKVSFKKDRPILDAAIDLMHRIFSDFEFKSGLTTIATPLSEVMKQRKGVCQDFAHLAIACVRALGLPARYVSGYIETLSPHGAEKLVGVDASHAWFSIYVPNMGWLDFDPTNNIIPSDQHITIGWGRDYADITPLKGIILSSGPHQLRVSVDVRRSDSGEPLL